MAAILCHLLSFPPILGPPDYLLPPMTEEQVSAPQVPTREMKLCWAKGPCLPHTRTGKNMAGCCHPGKEEEEEWD